MTGTDTSTHPGLDGWIEPTEDTAPFFAGAAEGLLRLQHCKACDALPGTEVGYLSSFAGLILLKVCVYPAI